MKGSVLLLMIAGLICFAAGAWLAPMGERSLGIGLMGVGLIFQVLTLRQMKLAKKRNTGDAG